MRALQVFDQHDLVVRFVVDELVDERFREEEAEAARAQAFFLARLSVRQGIVVGIVDRGVLQFFGTKAWPGIVDAIEQRAVGANVGDTHLLIRVEASAPLDRVIEQLAKREADAFALLLRQIRFEAREKTLHAVNHQAFARDKKLDPTRRRGEDLDRRARRLDRKSRRTDEARHWSWSSAADSSAPQVLLLLRGPPAAR